MGLSPAPTLTDSVQQTFFIEALGGARNPVSYLDRFPDSVYSKAFDSLLVKFLYALLGPVGVGKLRQEYLEARLQVEAAGLNLSDIDGLYANAFGFARLAEETYRLDAAAALLPAAQRAQILSQDAAFRNRAIDFLKGARAGGTNLGIAMVARSGLGRPVEAIENWRALYDRYADIPLGLPFFGTTHSTNEVIIVPRQVAPQSAIQTLTITGSPTQGWFSLSYPAAQNWQAVPVGCTAGLAQISVPTAAMFPAGTFVTLTNLPTNSTNLNPNAAGWNHATTFAQSAGGSGTTIGLVYPLGGGALAGLAANAPTTGNFIALVAQGQTGLLPYNATAGEIQDALSALPPIGLGNVIVSGGALPDQPITIQFVKALSDQPVALLAANIEPDGATGVTPAGSGTTPQLSDVTGSPLNVTANIVMGTVGIDADSQATTIAQADEYAMRTALDQTAPLTTLITTQDGEGPSVRQPVNTTYVGSSRVEVLRYVTGKTAVTWPPLDDTHWIERGVEHEAPQALSPSSQHYQGFHNLNSILAYTEAALASPSYGAVPPDMAAHWDSLVGTFSATQQLLVPGLQTFASDNAVQYLPTNALAPQPDPLVLGSTASGQAVINGVYPIDYYSLPGVRPPTKVSMWASMERNAGADYLEIDFGTPQAVNYLYFEAASVPFLIDVAYDTLDQAPTRSFQPVTIAPSSRSTTQLTYDKTATNMWTTCEIFFTNALGSMLYTRFIRIGFTRSPQGTPFAPPNQPVIPYSAEVRNLRIGRNVSTPNGGVVRFA